MIAREQEVDRKYQSPRDALLPIARRVPRPPTFAVCSGCSHRSHDADAALSICAPRCGWRRWCSAAEAQFGHRASLRGSSATSMGASCDCLPFLYQAAMVTPLARLQRARQPLTDIKALAGSSPAAPRSVECRKDRRAGAGVHRPAIRAARRAQHAMGAAHS